MLLSPHRIFADEPTVGNYSGIEMRAQGVMSASTPTQPRLQPAYLRPELSEGCVAMIAIVTTRQSTKERHPVNRQHGSIARLTATVLVVGLVGLASMACGRNGSPVAPGSPGLTQAAPATQAEAAGPTIGGNPSFGALESSPASADASAPASAAPSPSHTGSRAPVPAATSDPLDAELQALDQVVNDVNGSISGTDASSSSGE